MVTIRDNKDHIRVLLYSDLQGRGPPKLYRYTLKPILDPEPHMPCNLIFAQWQGGHEGAHRPKYEEWEVLSARAGFFG